MGLDFSKPRQTYRDFYGVEMPESVENFILKVCMNWDVKPDNMEILHYVTDGRLVDRMEVIPDKITQTAKSVLAEFRKAADAQAKASMENAHSSAAELLREVAEKIEHDVIWKKKWQWACGCFIVAALCVGGGEWHGRKGGVNEGIGIGYMKSRDEKAAASWANTFQGRKALLLSENGTLEKIIRCDGPGWSKEGGSCFPFPDQNNNNRVSGWKLP